MSEKWEVMEMAGIEIDEVLYQVRAEERCDQAVLIASRLEKLAAFVVDNYATPTEVAELLRMEAEHYYQQVIEG